MLTIYTDGACSGNPGKGGWAYKVLGLDGRDYLRGGCIPHTTSNAAEAMAVLHALQDTTLPHNTPIRICTDSQYVCFGIARLQRGSSLKTHTELWSTIGALLQKFPSVECVHVRAHHTDVHNKDCDKLAVAYTRG